MSSRIPGNNNVRVRIGLIEKHELPEVCDSTGIRHAIVDSRFRPVLCSQSPSDSVTTRGVRERRYSSCLNI
ncbi:hypothetical protein BD309DRAFT_955113 [Dichomitus squalens]|nr:hypothetical protein BD309DRAFT_955113 [Dichomitus squalens]